MLSCLVLCFSSILYAELPLELPTMVYAAPDIETKIYFDNLVLSANSEDYIFYVICAKGRNDAKRWRFIPNDEMEYIRLPPVISK